MADLISVIVSTYNRADALDAVLRSLSTQSDRNFEMIVADDGSRPDTGEVVGRWSARAGVPVRHVWHEDQDFRLAEIRNRAILASQGRYCIFLDGDCLAQPGFVAAHRREAQPGWFVTGSRLLLSQALTVRILADGEAAEQWSLGTWIGQRLRGGINRVGPLLLPWSGVSAKRNERRWRGARGSNMAFWRADLDAVDGFDAAFVGWGREDFGYVCTHDPTRHPSPQRAARSNGAAPLAPGAGPLAAGREPAATRAIVERDARARAAWPVSTTAGERTRRARVSSAMKVLIVTLRRLGDVLLTTPLVRSVRRGFPDARVDMLVFAGSERILKGNPDIDRVITAPERPSFAETARLVRVLWRQYDLAICTQTGDRPTFMTLSPRGAGAWGWCRARVAVGSAGCMIAPS